MRTELIERHWGKARGGEAGPGWHSLAYHALDVAAVMDAMLDADEARLGPLVAMGAGDAAAVRAGLVLAAALHDLGKHDPAFQAKAPEVPPGRARAGRGLDDPGHDRTGLAMWAARGRDWLGAGRRLSGAQTRLDLWVRAACCHHGRGWPSDGSAVAPRLDPEDWEAADAYVRFALGMPETAAWRGLTDTDDESGREDDADAAWVAGLVTQADWLGSNRERFGYRDAAMDAAAYWADARGRAQDVLLDRSVGLVVAPRAAPLTLAEALRVPDPEPTPLQRWAAEAPLPDAPCLAVIEDLTGAGKTEAAAVLASRMVAAGRATGVYWAMPTMATANAMYARAAPLVETIYGPEASAALMGGKRGLNAVFAAARAAGSDAEAADAVGGTDTVPAEVVCAEWLAQDGRLGFLAPVGAGTIDQALLGILPSRHFPVRLAGLGPRVLIVDEAHAYDSYTGRLLEELLRVHARAGGSAVVLSATLTSALHGRLVRAWRAGRGDGTAPPAPLALPCATLVWAGGDASESFEGAADRRGARRDTPVAWLRAPAEAVRVLAEAAGRGAACLWVRNTVQDAAEGRAMLAEAGVEARLFHSRLTAGDRGRVERDLLARFGPDGTDRAGVVVATQVAEQSLDVDFDAMVSDLAPYDALVQRAGRLHRHRRDRPEGYGAPVLHVLSPAPTDEAGAGWYADAFPVAQWVYPAHGRLWRGARRIEMDGGLRLASGRPRDLLDWVYAEEDGTPEALAAHDRLAEGEAIGERQQGALAGARLHLGYPHDDFRDEERAVTRLGSKDVPVLLARVEGGRLLPWERDEPDRWRAWALSEIAVRERDYGEGVVPEGLEGAVAAVTKGRPCLHVWVLDEAGRGRVRRGEGAVSVNYSADCGLTFTA